MHVNEATALVPSGVHPRACLTECYLRVHLIGWRAQVTWSDLIVLNTYVCHNGTDNLRNQSMHERRRTWDKEAQIFAKAVDRSLVWLGDLNVTLHDADVTHPTRFRHGKGTKWNSKEDCGASGFTPNEQRRFGELLRAGPGLVRHLSTHYSNLSP